MAVERRRCPAVFVPDSLANNAQMRQATTRLVIGTSGKGLYEFANEAARWVARSGIADGLLTLFCRYSSASLLITQNAAPAVQRDLLAWLEGAVPEGAGFEHNDEGPDDMPTHIGSMLTGASVQVLVASGRMLLGTWQGLFLAEHRAAPHKRQVAAHLLGERGRVEKPEVGVEGDEGDTVSPKLVPVSPLVSGGY